MRRLGRIVPRGPRAECPSPAGSGPGRAAGRDAVGAPLLPWSEPPERVLAALGASPERGLTADEVARRRVRHGPNRLRPRRPRALLRILLDQLRSLLVLLLLLAAGLAFAFGERLEGAAIAAVLALNAGIGFATELRAVRSLEGLRRLGEARAVVRRDGQARRVPATELVPGDVVLLEGGDVVPADLRLVEAAKLEADQSALTGESLPVPKDLDPVAPETPVPERSCMLFQGTALGRGSGAGVVVATGMRTELGRISRLVEEAQPEVTPLERRLEALARRLLALAVAIGGAVAAVGISSGREALPMIETGIALAVAAVPEGLPVVATLALARGMWRMARRHALVERLSAVETLGSTSAILCDKTGTLTENRMRAVAFQLADGAVEVGPSGFLRDAIPVDPRADRLLAAALRAAALCNNASLARSQEQAVGDPTEAALLEAAGRAGLYRDELLAEAPERREEPFDPSLGLMATVHQVGTGFEIAVKGAPEAVLVRSAAVRTPAGPRPLGPEARRDWLRAAERLAARGHRVLALAAGRADSAGASPWEGLEWLGLAALFDPPRAGVRPAIEACAAAGIRVVMVTGDHPSTARSVAEAVGLVASGGDARVVDARELGTGLAARPELRARLLGASVVARASPEQKLELIALHQQTGAVVAMTGDGVNDAPALRKADIGIAMGRRGTQVAREAAAMVLEDDEFATIAVAVGQGRVIFGNIRSFAVYLLSCNASEVLTVGLAALVQAPLPLLPLQILFLNLVTDVFPALALGFGEGGRDLMAEPPRPAREPILTPRHWGVVAVHGGLLTLAVLGALAAALAGGLSEPQAVTVSFLTLATAQLGHVFDARSPGGSALRNDVTRNPWVWGALGLCAALLAAALHIPLLARILELQPIGLRGAALVAVFGLAPMLAIQLGLALRRR